MAFFIGYYKKALKTSGQTFILKRKIYKSVVLGGYSTILLLPILHLHFLPMHLLRISFLSSTSPIRRKYYPALRGV